MGVLVDLLYARFPNLLRVEAACSELEAFRLARPPPLLGSPATYGVEPTLHMCTVNEKSISVYIYIHVHTYS